jgi:hypothetical protein
MASDPHFCTTVIRCVVWVTRRGPIRRMSESPVHASTSAASSSSDVSPGGSTHLVEPDLLATILAGPLPESLVGAYRSRHPLIDWVTATYPRAGNTWERQLSYAVRHAAEVQSGQLSLERYRRTLNVIARDPDGRRHGRRPSRTVPADPSSIDQHPADELTSTRSNSLGPELVVYVSTAVGWQLPTVITTVLEESTDLLVDLACRVAQARNEPFDMRVLADRSTWGRWRASSVLRHLPDRTRRSVEHIVCGHPKVLVSSAVHLMHTLRADQVALDVIAAWRGDLPGLHPRIQESYGRSEINSARLGTPPSAAEIIQHRAAHLAV